MRPKRRPSMLAVFTRDYKRELADIAAGSVPSHRALGVLELQDLGWEVSVASSRWRHPLMWRLAAVWSAMSRRWDVVYSPTEAMALWLLCAKRVGILRSRVAFVDVALEASMSRSLVRRAVWRWALRSEPTVLTYRLGCFGRDAVPLGVDCEWLLAGERPLRERFVLSVGTNQGKDYPTLIRAMTRLDIPLLIVTDSYNAQVIKSMDSTIEVRSNVPIADLRLLYKRCGLLVLPLRETGQATGQTVLLENLAIGTPMVVSACSSTIGYTGRGCVTVPIGDQRSMREAIVGHFGAAPIAGSQVCFHVAGTAARLDELLRPPELG